MIDKLQPWERELWYYVSSGNGITCPILDNCNLRLNGARCRCPVFGDYANTHRHDTSKQYCMLCEQSSDCGNVGGIAPCQASNIGFMESIRPGRISELLELLAENWLKTGHVQEPPVPSGLLYLFDQQRRIEVKALRLKAYSGAVWRMSDAWIIYLSTNDNHKKQRVTLFHEGFHILAHCRVVSPIFKKKGSRVGSFNELLADTFALYVLMPRKWIAQEWSKTKDTAILSQMFEVPEDLVVARLRALHLIS